MQSTNIPKSIDEYIAQFPAETMNILETIRKTIHQAVPSATEAISYQMPTFKLNGKNLVHFAAWKNHIGFYPTPSGTSKFAAELSKYHTAKGSVQFPLNQPMPLKLIYDVAVFRAKELAEKG